MKKLTRARVVPIIGARVSWLIFTIIKPEARDDDLPDPTDDHGGPC